MSNTFLLQYWVNVRLPEIMIQWSEYTDRSQVATWTILQHKSNMRNEARVNPKQVDNVLVPHSISMLDTFSYYL